MPDWKLEIRRRLDELELEPAREAAIVEELAQDLEDCYEELLMTGATEEDAYGQTLAELRESAAMRRELRRVERQAANDHVEIGIDRRRNMIADLWQDLRYGARSFWKNPGFTAVVVLTLALGIGANVGLFSVVNGVLLNPLPFPQPEQLVLLRQGGLNSGEGALPYLNFRDLQKENQTFTGMAIARPYDFDFTNLTGAGEFERLGGQLVSAEYFSVLGVRPALGRTFIPDEDKPGAGPVAVISSGFWRRKFGAAPDVVGKSLPLGDKRYTIVGVLPESFTFSFGSFTGESSDVYAPVGQWDHPGMRNRSAGLNLQGIGRLKPGVTIERAQADLSRVSRNLADAFPDTNKDIVAKVFPLKERVVGDVGATLWTLLGAVGFVLLIACVNVSNLLLARSTGRAREFAIRAALGAGRGRLLRQTITESVLLAMAGGGLGLLLSNWATHAALAALPSEMPRAQEIRLDARVLFFTLAVSLAAGILSCLAPALKTSQRRLSETLKEGGRSAGAGRRRAQSALVAVEMALALVLLIGAGLMIRSLAALWSVDPGFRPDLVLSFSLNLPPSLKSSGAQAIRADLRDLGDKLNVAPGVRAVSFSRGSTPLQGDDEIFFWLDGKPKPAAQSEMNLAVQYVVDARYLAVMGVPLKRGRFFTEQDDERSQRVVVIDEDFARKYFPNEDPVGKRVNLMESQAQIIGVVGHVKQRRLDTDDRQALEAQIYEALWQAPDRVMARVSGVDAFARVEGGDGTIGSAAVDSIRRSAQAQHGQNVMYDVRTMNEIIANSLASRRFSMILLETFAATALLLASVGLYGVISYLVGQRAREIGVRLALGAGRADVLRLVLADGMKMALAGVALGLLAAFGLTRLLTKMLYGVSATDPLTFAAVTLSLSAVALLACFVPAWRATKVDPLVALRYE
jgi:predicted permease